MHVSDDATFVNQIDDRPKALVVGSPRLIVVVGDNGVFNPELRYPPLDICKPFLTLKFRSMNPNDLEIPPGEFLVPCLYRRKDVAAIVTAVGPEFEKHHLAL